MNDLGVSKMKGSYMITHRVHSTQFMLRTHKPERYLSTPHPDPLPITHATWAVALGMGLPQLVVPQISGNSK